MAHNRNAKTHKINLYIVVSNKSRNNQHSTEDNPKVRAKWTKTGPRWKENWEIKRGPYEPKWTWNSRASVSNARIADRPRRVREAKWIYMNLLWIEVINLLKGQKTFSIYRRTHMRPYWPLGAHMAQAPPQFFRWGCVDRHLFIFQNVCILFITIF